VFTSGIVSTKPGHRIALYFTGRQHAGENPRDVLTHRAEALAAPVQMSDALSRNTLSRNTSALPEGVEILLANCLAHGRRQFAEVAANFPEACRYVLETLGSVYKYDAEARAAQLSPQDRLRFHQRHSEPLMTTLHQWMETQFTQHLVEPNSGLGKAITYFLRHWKGLTAFLRDAGAPLDNNICERALKRAVLHRKNALFYRTLNGAEVGDLFMSLIHTCGLPFACVPLQLGEVVERIGVRERILRSGCTGTTARRWRGSPHRQPGNMMNPAWPERIDCGHGGVTFPNARQTGLSEGKIW
jgi:hypothetical protein